MSWQKLELKHLLLVVVAAILNIVLLLLMYVYVWGSDESYQSYLVNYWSAGFYDGAVPYSEWLLNKCQAIVYRFGRGSGYLFIGDYYGQAITMVILVLGILGFILGGTTILLLLPISALGVLLIFSHLHYWPFGDHRPNLFLSPYVMFILLGGFTSSSKNTNITFVICQSLVAFFFVTTQLPLNLTTPLNRSIQPIAGN